MSSVSEFLKRASERNGFIRDRYEEKKVPTEFTSLAVMPFFGDYRSLFILSSLLLNRYRHEDKGSKYFILASWPGFQGLFPYVDEYWSMADEAQVKRFYEQSDGFRNKADLMTIYLRNLNEFFRDVIDSRDIDHYYDNGIRQAFFDRYKIPQRYLPFVPSASVLGKEFNRQLAIRPGYKLFIHPMIYGKQWHMGRTKNIRCKREFWSELVQRLLKNGYVPVIWQNYLTYDLSAEFVDKCIFFGDHDIIRVLAAMRATGCVLDVFNGLSRFAIAARCPFLAIDERSRYSYQKEYEIDDLCAPTLPKEYIFTFSTIISDGNQLNWNLDIFQAILNKLDSFLPTLNREDWPTTAESTETVAYREYVRKIESKKFGTRLLKITHD